MRRLPSILLGLVLVAALAHAAYWLWTVRVVEEGFARWVAERRSAGWTVAHGTPVRGGWPMAATLTLPATSVAGGTAIVPGGFAWFGESLTVRLPLFDPHRIELVPHGAQRIRAAGSPDIPFTAERLVATLPLTPGNTPRRADMAADGLRLTLPVAPTGTPARPVEIGAANLHADWHDEPTAEQPALAILLDAGEITLPPDARWPLGNRVRTVSLDAAVIGGPVTPASDLRAQLQAWRDGGGRVEIRRLGIGWGPLGLTARGDLTLDKQLQPAGAAAATLVGYAEAADMMASTGTLSRPAATAVKAVLGLLARVPQDGGQAEVEVPLTLQDRTLSMSLIPLMRVPVVVWAAIQ